MRITLELEADDIARFQQTLARAERRVACADECDIVDAARHALDTLPIGGAPGYVRQRMVEVQRLLLMLEDAAWALPGDLRREVLRVLAYFCDPDDLIPDDVEVVGLLDDAIMLDLLLRRLRHTLCAYADFCRYRQTQVVPDNDDCAAYQRRAGSLARRRDALHARMRRRAQRQGVAS